MRIPSGKIDQSIYFVAVDSTDLKTRKTGLSSFTVYRSRNNGTATVYTTPTITELSAANMPGVYSLLIDEDSSIASTSDSEEYCLHITQASMAPVTRVIELYRYPVTSGASITVANGAADADLERIQGTVISTPATAGILDVNTKNINNVAAATPGASGGILISGSNSGTTTLGALTVTGNLLVSDGMTIASPTTTNREGLKITGNGSGAGILVTGGAAVTTTPAGHALNLVGGASSTGAGGVAGFGLLATGGAGSASVNGAAGGAKFVGGGTNTVTSAAFGLRVEGTSTGAGLRAISGTGSSAHGIETSSAGAAGIGLYAKGNTSGGGIVAEGGTTGVGLECDGGATSGPAMYLSTSDGDGLLIEPVGSSRHGMNITGGNAGVSDGIKVVAGTGGVAIRANITGNITGTLDTVTTATNVTTVNGLAANVITATSIATDAITAGKIAADAIGASELAADAVTEIRSVANGTSDSGTTTTMVDAARTEADTDYWKGGIIVFTSGNVLGEARLITGFNAATDTITFAPATTQAIATQTYEIWPTGRADVHMWQGTSIAPDTAGYPIVTVKDGSGQGEILTTSGVIDTVTTATNVTTVNGLAANVITATSIAADAIGASELAADAVTEIRSVVSGTSDSGTSTTMVDAARTEADTDYWKDMAILFTSGTIIGQTRLITAFNPATDTITFSPATTQAVSTQTYEILTNVAAAGASAPTAAEVADAVWDEDATAHQTQGSYGQAIGDPVADTNTIYKAVVTDATGATVGVDVVAVKAETASIQVDTDDIQTKIGTPSNLGGGATLSFNLSDIEAQTDDIGAAGAGLTAIDLPDQTMNITGNITGNVSGSVGSVTGAVTVGTINANVITATSINADAITAAKIADGAIDAATFASGAINAAAIATDAIGAAELAADAVTEIRSLASGTSDSGTTTTMVDAARTEADTDYWKDQVIVFTSGNILGQARLITGFTPGTDTITFAPATTQAVATQTYEIWPGSYVDLGAILGTAVSTPATAGILDVNVKNIDNDAASASGTVTFPNATLASTTNITSATGVDITKILGTAISTPATAGILDVNVKNIDNDLASASGTVTFPNATLASTTNITAGTVTTTTSVTNAVTVGTINANVITATSIQADAITDAKVASDVTIASVTGAVGSVTAAVAITSNVKQNQALASFTFLMTDSTTHAPKTGVTVTVTRSIDGGAFAAGTLSAVTEVSNGIYKVDFAAADLNGKVIVLRATGASSDDTFERISTQP